MILTYLIDKSIILCIYNKLTTERERERGRQSVQNSKNDLSYFYVDLTFLAMLP